MHTDGTFLADFLEILKHLVMNSQEILKTYFSTYANIVVIVTSISWRNDNMDAIIISIDMQRVNPQK